MKLKLIACSQKEKKNNQEKFASLKVNLIERKWIYDVLYVCKVPTVYMDVIGCWNKTATMSTKCESFRVRGEAYLHSFIFGF